MIFSGEKRLGVSTNTLGDCIISLPLNLISQNKSKCGCLYFGRVFKLKTDAVIYLNVESKCFGNQSQKHKKIMRKLKSHKSVGADKISEEMSILRNIDMIM